MPRKKQSTLDRRLQEIEKEAQRIHGDIKSLSKALNEPGGKMPRLKSDPLERRRTDPPATQKAKPGPAVDKARVSPLVPKANKEPDLFNWASDDVTAGPPAQKNSDHLSPDRRFASYLTASGFSHSGSGGRPMSTRQPKSEHRNKAIFMIVVVLVGLYVVLNLVFR